MKFKLIEKEKYKKILQENQRLREENEILIHEFEVMESNNTSLRKKITQLQSYMQERPLIGNNSFMKDKEQRYEYCLDY